MIGSVSVLLLLLLLRSAFRVLRFFYCTGSSIELACCGVCQIL